MTPGEHYAEAERLLAAGAEVAKPLQVVVGQNCRRVREAGGVTQNTLARYARESGLRWNAAKVGHFERGQNSPTFATVLAVTHALTCATGWPVGLADLVMTDGFVTINEELFAPSGERLQQIVCGSIGWADLASDDVSPSSLPAAATDAEAVQRAANDFRRLQYKYEFEDAGIEELLEISRKAGTDEDRLAKRLRISGPELVAASWRAWGRTFSEERDDRAGPDANAQKRGRVARNLQAELEDEKAAQQ